MNEVRKISPIRVLVTDDSAFMRSAIKGMLNSDPGIEVIGTARDGQEAIEKIETLRPDIMTLDLEMPRMDGLTALRIIMEKTPMPVLVVSSLTAEGAKVTFDALELGAVDFVCKDLQNNVMNVMGLESRLIDKIKEIALRKLTLKPVRAAGPAPALPPIALTRTGDGYQTHNVAVVALGVSTGGPKALHEVIPRLPKEMPAPILIVQHMPAMFTGPFSERLNSLSQVRVKEAQAGDLLEAGTVYVAPGGIHMRVRRSRAIEVRIELTQTPIDSLYRPCVNVMMLSVAEAYGGRVLGVIMTGMGNDGTEGIRELKRLGGKSLAQDEKSCIVYGMPKSIVDAGLADKVVPLSELAGEIVNMV